MKITKRQLRRIIEGQIESMSVDKRDQLIDMLGSKYGLRARTTEEFDGTPGGVWFVTSETVPSPPAAMTVRRRPVW